MFAASSHVYDLIYDAAGKDYVAEVVALTELVATEAPDAVTLLDVACGTGAHLALLRDSFEVVGLDASPEMLAVAADRLGDIELTCADMRSFSLGRSFDVVTCLFSSIGYLPDANALGEAVATMAAHLNPGGVLVVDGWVREDRWREGTVHALAATRDGVAVARVGRTQRRGQVAILEMHHLVGTVDGVEHITETHELTLFTDDEYRAAFAAAGLEVRSVPSPYQDRDRYVGHLTA